MQVCDQCGSRFSGDARFCPFDGDPLRTTDEPSSDALVGLVVDGRYEVQEVMGEGGMGTVYRVRHAVIERPFALKALRSDLSRESELGIRFLREAQAIAAISHPNVVQITDFGSLPSGQPYFVMEHLPGDALSVVLRRSGRLPAPRAVRLVGQIVDALAAAHTAGVVHRDLKPDNILVCPGTGGEEVIKVLDFGLAKIAGQSRLTREGLVFGTPHYMSPEQATGGTVDERTDVYALGVVMYQMFTGHVPFEADTYMGVLTKHLYVAPTPPSVHVAPGELGALEQLVLRCLEKKPEKRFASMTALAAELRRLTSFDEDGSLRVEPPELGRPVVPTLLADELEIPLISPRQPPRRRPHLPVWAGAALATAALVVIAIFGWGRLGSRDQRAQPGPALASLSAPSSFDAVPSGGLEPVVEQPSIGPVESAASSASGDVFAGDAPRPRSVEARDTLPRRATPKPPAAETARTASRGVPKSAQPMWVGSVSSTKSPTKKDNLAIGDIVDPWSK